MIKVIGRVLIKPLYFLLAFMIASIIISVSLLFPNRELMLKVASSNSLSVLGKIKFIASFYGAITTNFTLFSAFYTLTIAILFAINITLLAFYVRRRQKLTKNMTPIFGTGIGGLVAGFLGIGCAACGSFVVTSLLSLLGAGALLSFLPLGGEELGLIGIALLLYSIYSLVKKMDESLVCNG